MDGVDSDNKNKKHGNFLVLVATSGPSVLDLVSLWPGRFDETSRVPLLDTGTRKESFQSSVTPGADA